MSLNPPATVADVDTAERQLAIKLPEPFRNFLLHANGGEGLSNDRGYVILWRADELAPRNAEYEVNLLAPGFVVFGTNGGGEAYCFDCRAGSQQVWALPFIGMEPGAARARAASFAHFIAPLLALVKDEPE